MCAAPIFLFTDFGSADIYVGQVKAVLHALCPESAVIDLINDLAPYDVEAAAHLLPALAQHLPSGAVTICVVDPGVGSARGAVAVLAEGRWFLAPDNGLVSVVAARSTRPAVYDLGPPDRPLSASFHGRDFFAPHAAALAMSQAIPNALRARKRLDAELGPGDLWKIVHVDRYGNAVTGIRASSVGMDDTLLRVAGRTLRRARVFAACPRGNSSGTKTASGSSRLRRTRPARQASSDWWSDRTC